MQVPPPIGNSSMLWAKALCAATAASAVHLCINPWMHDACSNACLCASETVQKIQGFGVPPAPHFKAKDNEPTAF